MKSLLVLAAAVLFTSQANADVAVGDMVRYNMTSVAGGQTRVMEEKMEVTAVDTSAGTYTMNVTVSYNGTQVSQTTNTTDLNSAEESESTLDHCSEMPADVASIETITVPAGTFQVCHIKSNENGVQVDEYMGKVLFGLVKSVTASATSTTTFELLEVKQN